MWRDMGFQVAEGRAFTPILQGSCVGGTTAINGAIIHRMPPVIHEQWHAERGVGDALPYAELERVWNRLDEELSVGPAPDAVFGNNNALMEQAVARLGLSGNRIRRNVKGCEGSGHCNQGSSSDLLVIGAYPNGMPWDIRRGDPAEHDEAVANIRAVPLPDADPVEGSEGALTELWS